MKFRLINHYAHCLPVDHPPGIQRCLVWRVYHDAHGNGTDHTAVWTQYLRDSSYRESLEGRCGQRDIPFYAASAGRSSPDLVLSAIGPLVAGHHGLRRSKVRQVIKKEFYREDFGGKRVI